MIPRWFHVPPMPFLFAAFNRKERRAFSARGWSAFALGLCLLALGCKPRPCVSPIQGKPLPPRPIHRTQKLPKDAPLEAYVQALVLDLRDALNYGEALERPLVELGAIPTDPKEETTP
jgi:hypothetical protein